MLADFIVTKANNLGFSLTQVVNVNDATIISAIPAQYREHVSGVVLRKAKQSAIDKYIDQKAQSLADNSAFKSAVSGVIPELNITQTIVKRVIVQKVKEFRV
jgi:predicted RNA-binding protein with PIN domain